MKKVQKNILQLLFLIEIFALNKAGERSFRGFGSAVKGDKNYVKIAKSGVSATFFALPVSYPISVA